MIKIITFEGLNRSGKGTQIKMLRDHCQVLGYPVEVLRGDGSRPGIGSQGFYDPQSPWWRDWQANQEKTSCDWNLAYHVLTEENSRRYKEFCTEHRQGMILMDRSYVSRYFMLKQQGLEMSLETVALDTPLHPELFFFLDVSQGLLLERASDDNPRKAGFRKEIAQRWYPLWNSVVETAQNYLKDRLRRIDGTLAPEIIHDHVKAYL